MARRKRCSSPLSTFLQESSIHGLRYLAMSEGASARTAWLLAVCSSLCAACAIVYLNLEGWMRSPVVVTTVKTVTVKVGDKEE